MAVTDHPWLKSYPNEVRWDQEIPTKRLDALLDDTVAQFPNNAFVDFLGCKYTYTEIAGQVGRAAAGFQGLGVDKGIKVGLFLPNCPQYIVAYYGILKAGGTVVNYSPLYDEEELLHQIEDSQTDIMVTLSLQALYPKMASMLKKSRVDKLVVGTLQEALPFPKNWLFPLVKRGDIATVPNDREHVSFRELLANEGAFRPVEIDPNKDVAVLQYTGGTTGVAKGAMLSHANLYANAIQAKLWFTTVEPGRERMMGVLPFFHVFAMTSVMNLSISIGAEIIMHPRFELEPVMKDISRKKPTLMPGVPTMFAAILNHPRSRQVRPDLDQGVYIGRCAAAARDQAALRKPVGVPAVRRLRAHRKRAGGLLQSHVRPQQGRFDWAPGSRHYHHCYGQGGPAQRAGAGRDG